MTGETRDRIIDSVFMDLEAGDEVTFAFQGGEPTLAGLPWFRAFVEKVAALAASKTGLAIHYALQTNGILLDEAWCAFFREHKVLVGLSIDGGERFHDMYRVNEKGEGTYHAVLEKKRLLETQQVEYNALCVLTNENAKEPDKVWRFLQREHIDYVQFIPCLEESSVTGTNSNVSESARRALKRARFAQFYIRLFSLWARELAQGRYISVKFFDDVAHLFLHGVASSCGITGQCQAQYVVEADASVYPCDFFALDAYNAGNLTQKTLRQLFDAELTQQFLREKQRLPPLCDNCAYLEMCRGGCKRMRNVMYFGPDSAICGYKTFLDACLQPLLYTVRRYFP
jgi:uncharacterized protein